MFVCLCKRIYVYIYYGMHEFSELVLDRIALLKDHGHNVLPLTSVKVREFNLAGCGEKKCPPSLFFCLFLFCTQRGARTNARSLSVIGQLCSPCNFYLH